MPWPLLLFLHARATWAGFAYTGYSDVLGWALSQAFFAGVLLLLAALGRAFPSKYRWLAAPVAALGLALALAGWTVRVTGETARSLGDGSSRSRWGLMWSSAREKADLPLAEDLLLALGATAAVLIEKKRSRPLGSGRLAGAAAAGLALILLGAAHEPRDFREESPLLSLLRAWQTTPVPAPDKPVADLSALMRGSFSVEGGLADALQSRRRALGLPQGHRPNLVLLFLESTGYGQLFPGGRMDPALTPNLDALSGHAVLFPAMYTPFPGTVRAHLAVMTGGKFITWGSEYKELSHRYLGPTLPGELKKRGYRTGFFSAVYLNSENMDGLYRGLAFDKIFSPDAMPASYQKEHALNSWGIDDREVIAQALRWVDAGRGPFFLAIDFDATHHPYSIPDDFPALRRGDSDRERFDDALHFVDYAVGRLSQGLRARRLDDTIFLVMGDHGEAFGDLHPGNFTHRNFLYEENVRSFLLVADLAGRIQPLVSGVPIAHGAVLPTALELVDQERVSGSAFEPEPRIEYFFKNTHPEKWGLRDGPWKFIADILEPRNAELYRLDQDPTEQHNLAALYPDKVKAYRERVTSWYVYKNREFTSRLADYAFEGGRGLEAADLTEPGPKRLAFGYMDGHGKFIPEKEVPEDAKITAWTQDVPYPKGRSLVYRWTGPDGAWHAFVFYHDPEWSDVFVFPKASFSMTPGTWSLEIFDGSRELLHGSFRVTAPARAAAP